jgi:hypothetical protein
MKNLKNSKRYMKNIYFMYMTEIAREGTPNSGCFYEGQLVRILYPLSLLKNKIENRCFYEVPKVIPRINLNRKISIPVKISQNFKSRETINFSRYLFILFLENVIVHTVLLPLGANIKANKNF